MKVRLGDTSGIDIGCDGWRIGRYRQVLAGWLSSLHGPIKSLHFLKSAFFL
jgi:hypothetical protein